MPIREKRPPLVGVLLGPISTAVVAGLELELSIDWSVDINIH